MSTVIDVANIARARIAALDEDIARAKVAVAGIKANRAPLERAAGRARRLVSWLKLKRWIRGPARHYDLWKVGLLLTGAALVVAICFVLTDLFIDSVNLALYASIVGGAAAGGILTGLLYFPNDSRLVAAIVDAEIQLKAASGQLANQCATDGLQQRQLKLKELMAERCCQLVKLRAEIASEMRHRRSLLEQDWRSMRDYEWEEFLVRVFNALGAKAQRIGGAGDQGVDLIIEIGPRRIAVQAKGYLNSVSNKAIQEAFTGMVHHGCTDCAVITNSRFTKGAYDVAVSTGCILIGEDEFPNLVIGDLKLLNLRGAKSN
jgi:restriction system protein